METLTQISRRRRWPPSHVASKSWHKSWSEPRHAPSRSAPSGAPGA